jgi:hypothetical protein
LGVDGSFFQSYCCLSDHNPAHSPERTLKLLKYSYLGSKVYFLKEREREREKEGKNSK